MLRREKQQMVYMLRGNYTGRYKLGKTTNLERRLNEIRMGASEEIVVIWTLIVRNHSLAETSLHRKFKAKRVRGEWFNLSDEDVEWVLNAQPADLLPKGLL